MLTLNNDPSSQTQPDNTRSGTSLLQLALIFTVMFWYLGITPSAAVLGAVFWLAQGTVGVWVLRFFLVRPSREDDALLLLGPGVLLGIGITTAVYLLARGGIVGSLVVVGLLLSRLVVWFRAQPNNRSADCTYSALSTVLLMGCALFANSREFPNLLIPGIAVLAIGLTWTLRSAFRYRFVVLLGALVALAVANLRRSAFWWWASDDTTMLSAIGTTIIKRGQIAHTAGWSTESYHWFLHAWLALWNQLSFGNIFETYQVMWPLVASVSVFASLWLILNFASGVAVLPQQFAGLGVIGAGLVQIEWTAPQEQQPFLYAMIAVCAWRLGHNSRRGLFSKPKTTIGVVMVIALIPVVLYFTKPSLLAAWGLLVAGAAIEYLRRKFHFGLIACLVLACSVLSIGLSLMRIGSSWVSNRYITSFKIEFLSSDLGWCQRSSLFHAVLCVLSLKAVFVAVLAAALVILMVARFTTDSLTLVVLVLPLTLAFLPFRLLITSGVGSGAPSFYRLSEMAVVTLVLLALRISWSARSAMGLALTVFLGVAFVAVQAGMRLEFPSDFVGPLLLRVNILQYLDSADVIAVLLSVIGSLLLSQVLFRRRLTVGLVAAACFTIASIPTAQLVSETTSPEDQSLRATRPEFLGPPDIEAAAAWLRQHTKFGTLIATNYLCDRVRMDECLHNNRDRECAYRQPVLTASWVLSALSQREFMYLSQGWQNRPSSYFLHEASTRLGSEVSASALDELTSRNVELFVASREHSSPQSWAQFGRRGLFASEHFIIVDLDDLREEL